MSTLESLATRLNQLAADRSASYRYDLFAGALVWSDEHPAWDAAEPDFAGLGELRALWAYRTSLMLGEPREQFQGLWEKARRLCPNWPGLLPERRDPALADTYRRLAEAAVRSWEEWDTRFEQQQNRQPKQASA